MIATLTGSLELPVEMRLLELGECGQVDDVRSVNNKGYVMRLDFGCVALSGKFSGNCISEVYEDTMIRPLSVGAKLTLSK